MISHKATMCLTSADVAVSCSVAMAMIAHKYHATMPNLSCFVVTVAVDMPNILTISPFDLFTSLSHLSPW